MNQRGFYGDERYCHNQFSRQGQPVCQAVLHDLVGDYESMASFRSKSGYSNSLLVKIKISPTH